MSPLRQLTSDRASSFSAAVFLLQSHFISAAASWVVLLITSPWANRRWLINPPPPEGATHCSDADVYQRFNSVNLEGNNGFQCFGVTTEK